MTVDRRVPNQPGEPYEHQSDEHLMQTDSAGHVVRETEELFTVEQRGIEYIPPEDRYGKPSDLFWMWAGVITNVFFVVFGALLIGIGLSFAQSIVVILVGNLSYFLVGLASQQGPDAGTSAFMITRAPFGQNGGRLLSFFMWLTMLGFEASALVIVVLALEVVLGKMGVGASDGLKVALIVLSAAGAALVPFYGHKTILKVMRWLVYPLVICFVLMAILVAHKINLDGVAKSGSFAQLTVGFVIIAASGGLSWTLQGNDYSRYLPRNCNRKGLFWWPSVGGLLPSVLLEILGAAVASVTPAASDPISGLPSTLPSWFLVPYLLIISAQLLISLAVDLYSSGLALQAAGLPIKRWQAVIVDAVVCCGIVAIAIFSSNFNKLLADFIQLVVIWIAPWLGIFLTDWVLRRGRYSPRDLLRDVGGLYWRQGGLHWPGMIAQLAGMALAALCVNTAPYIGPIAKQLGNADISIFAGLGVGALVYYTLGRASVAREAGATAALGREPEPKPALETS